MHPAILEVLQHFNFSHLPDHLQEISRDYATLAVKQAARGGGPECTTALRRLLEAKDCAIRAALPGNAAEKVEALLASLPAVHTVRVEFNPETLAEMAEIRRRLDMLDPETRERLLSDVAAPTDHEPPEGSEGGPPAAGEENHAESLPSGS